MILKSMVKILSLAASLWLATASGTDNVAGTEIEKKADAPVAIEAIPRKPKDIPISEIRHVDLREQFRPKNWFRTWLLYDLDQFIGVVSYERAIASHVAMGLKFEIFDVFENNPTLDGYGVLLSRTFFTQRSFQGFAAHMAAGAFFLDGSANGVDRSSICFGAELGGAWRFQLRQWIGIGFIFQARYISRPNMGGLESATKKFHPLRASLGLDVALKF